MKKQEHERYLTEKVFLVEKKMIPIDRWSEVPEYVMDEVRGAIEDRIPIGFAHDAELGWCILSTGQGPFFVWVEAWDKEKPCE
jgi:hypothetical protein